VGQCVIIFVGILFALLGIFLMTNFRGSRDWWYDGAARSLRKPREAMFTQFSERSLGFIVGTAFVVCGALIASIAAANF
jgi:hypothetical protein